MANGNGWCCGNPWNNSVEGVCGDFTEPTTPDQGQCAPRRVKRSCEAPDLPVSQCEDDEYTTEYTPENPDSPFTITARLFDEDCELITDESGDPIITTLV